MPENWRIFRQTEFVSNFDFELVRKIECVCGSDLSRDWCCRLSQTLSSIAAKAAPTKVTPTGLIVAKISSFAPENPIRIRGVKQNSGQGNSNANEHDK